MFISGHIRSVSIYHTDIFVWKVERRCREGQESEQRLTAWHSLALTCPRTCGLCDDTSPTTCQLPRSWRGTWTDAASGAAVTINETALHVSRRAADDEDQDEVDGGLTMGCVRWRTNASSEAENDLMLVTLYGAGCRPRYRCARVLRQTSSLLYLQLSDASSWPLVRSPRDPVDCRAFHFDRWTSSPPAVSATTGSASTTSGYLLSLVAATSASSTVDCSLPPDVAGVQYEAEFVVDGVDQCSGTLTESGGSTLRLAVFGCGAAVLRQFADPIYKCLDSSPVAADSQHDRVIITSSGDGSTLSCWLFTRVIRRGRGRGRSSSARSFYLLTGDQCHVVVAARSRSSFRPSRQLTYTAFFSRPRPLSTTTVQRPRSTPSQSSDVTDPMTPSTVWTSESPQRPRPHNVTTAGSDDDEQSDSLADAFIVAVASIIMAVIQLILLLCWC